MDTINIFSHIPMVLWYHSLHQQSILQVLSQVHRGIFMEDHQTVYDNSEVNNHLEVSLPSIWTFKAVGYTKFIVVFHENDSI